MKVLSLKKNNKFTTQIDVNLRTRYYLISYLKRMERENKTLSYFTAYSKRYSPRKPNISNCSWRYCRPHR